MPSEHSPSASVRKLPALEPETAFYWQAGKDGVLKICRCQSCQRYIHPPLPRCPACQGEVQPEAVSGRGRVASYTINRQQWLPGMKVPFVFAAVELEEQKELYVMTNITGCPVDAVHRGQLVEVGFELHEDIYLPVFSVREGSHVD